MTSLGPCRRTAKRPRSSGANAVHGNREQLAGQVYRRRRDRDGDGQHEVDDQRADRDEDHRVPSARAAASAGPPPSGKRGVRRPLAGRRRDAALSALASAVALVSWRLLPGDNCGFGLAPRGRRIPTLAGTFIMSCAPGQISWYPASREAWSAPSVVCARSREGAGMAGWLGSIAQHRQRRGDLRSCRE